MDRLKQVILAIAVSVLFCLAWDALSRHHQEEEARQQYFPITPVSKVQAGGHRFNTDKMGDENDLKSRSFDLQYSGTNLKYVAFDPTGRVVIE